MILTGILNEKFGPKFGSPRWTSTMSLTTSLKPYKFQCFSSCWPSCCQYFIRRVQKTSLGTAGGKLWTPLTAKSNPRRQVLPLLLNSPLEPLVGEPTVREKISERECVSPSKFLLRFCRGPPPPETLNASPEKNTSHHFCY